MAKENTELKSDESAKKVEIKDAISSLTEEQDAARKKRNKRIVIWNGGLAAFLLLATVVPGAITGHWFVALPNLVGLFWLGFVTILELENSNLKWIMGMQRGLHELERAEIDTLMESMKPIMEPKFHSKSEERRVKATKASK